MTNERKDKLIDKVAKLLAHAESAKDIGSLAEAEAFAAQAHRLMTDNLIGMSDIEYAAVKEEQVDRTYLNANEFGFNNSSRRITWAERLAYAVAKAHFCRAFGGVGTNRIQFIGATQDREQAVRVFITLMTARDSLGKKEYGAMRKRGEITKGFWSGWNKGFTAGVVAKVHAEMQDVKEEIANTETALMRISDAVAKTDEYVDKNIRTVKASHGTGYGHRGAYGAGNRAGRGSSFKNDRLT